MSGRTPQSYHPRHQEYRLLTEWREVERREPDWASRSLQREFELLVMIEVRIEEMFRSN
jgi:hypothetical protein